MPRYIFDTPQNLPGVPKKVYDVKSPEGYSLLALLYLESAHWHRDMWQGFNGIPSVQFPMDYYTLRLVVEKAKPDIIIETGTAFGGTALFLASLLHGLGKSGPVYSTDLFASPETQSPRRSAVKISQERWGIPLEFVTSSSTDPDTLLWLHRQILPEAEACVLVILDSDHSKKHVLEELQTYSSFVTRGSYMVVCDTHCRIISDDFKKERSWDMAADPLSAVQEFLEGNVQFQNDQSIDRFPLSTTRGGILLRVR